MLPTALGSGTLGLPRGDGASLDVLGKEGTLSQCKGPSRTHWPLSSLPRLPWLRQRLLPQLYGLLPHLGERPLARVVPWGAKHPLCRGVRLGWLLWGQQRQQGQWTLGASAMLLWQGCQAAGLFLAEGTECCGKGEGEGAGGDLHMWPLHVLLPCSVPLPTPAGTGWGSSIATGQHSQRVSLGAVPAGSLSCWAWCWCGQCVLGLGGTKS